MSGLREVLIGCKPGCVHRLPDEVRTVHLPGLQPSAMMYASSRCRTKECQVEVTTERCRRQAERIARRQDIYNRADATMDMALAEGLTYKRASRRRRKVADEYAKQPCPFWEASA
jgi:RNA-splicing ligase RtcB